MRSIGSDLRMDYTVVGQTTNVAARMEQMALPGSILISADTLALAEGYVHVTPLGPLKIKGLELPLEVYEVVGATTVRSRLHAAAARGLTRFVGRDAEMEQLRQARPLFSYALWVARELGHLLALGGVSQECIGDLPRVVQHKP